VTTILQATTLRQIELGTKVDKATAIVPASATGTIFTVSGGRVVVTSIVGELTAAADGTATTLKITSTPTTGTAVDLTTATAITSKEIGALIGLPLTFGGALNVQNAGGNEIPGAVRFLVPIGTIQITTSATNLTASIKWSLTYFPFDDGASVA
jgi:hypothetical protein